MREVYIAAAVRTAIGKAKRALALQNPVQMGAAVLKEAAARAKIAPENIQDVVIGCAYPEGEQGMNFARITTLAAGFPDTVPAMTLNRFCSSGLEAIHVAAAKIRAGYFDVAVGGGIESMSAIPMAGVKFAPDPKMSVERPEIYISMGNCGDNVARDFDITREQCDEWALRSHVKAIAAIDAGKFKQQITPLQIETPNGIATFDTDEGPRRETTLEGLAALKPAFAAPGKNGVCTAGNSSQMSDGAAAVLLMSKEALEKYDIKPLAKVLGYAVAAGDPKYLGPPQLEAIPRACALSGVDLREIGLFENNEAFASQCLFVIRELEIDPDKVNVNGGAIALGHPLGCTGSKLTAQIIHEMRDRNVKYGLVTMCIGGGMGAAGLFELCE
jgi:acetyl-CoA acyltransferase